MQLLAFRCSACRPTAEQAAHMPWQSQVTRQGTVEAIAKTRKIEQMPILSNPRHETFAHSLAAGKSIDAAYRDAGYSPNRGNASRLNTKHSIIARVGELKALIQDMRNLSSHRAVLTSEFVTEQLIGVVIDARSQEKPDSAGANKALHLLGLSLGMFVKREETGKPGEFDGLTIEGKRERLMGIALQLGLRQAR